MQIQHRFVRGSLVGLLGSVVLAACAAPPEPASEAEVSAASTYIYPSRSDHWGCDTDNQPLIGILVNSLGDHGACCDNHDACLASVPGCQGDSAHWQVAYNCQMGFQTVGCDDPCIQCHLGVVACLTGPATGVSQCVGFGNCGDARRADNAFGCTNDQICKVTSGQFSVCNPDNGLCEGPGFPDCPSPGCYNVLEQHCYQPGDCGPGRVLDANSCSCVNGNPTTCTPCAGQSCGTDLSCGTGLSCGTCSADYTCNSNGNCEHVDSCFSVCGDGVCECSEASTCPSDCSGGGGGDGSCPEDCLEVCMGTGLCSNGTCLCGT